MAALQHGHLSVAVSSSGLQWTDQKTANLPRSLTGIKTAPFQHLRRSAARSRVGRSSRRMGNSSSSGSLKITCNGIPDVPEPNNRPYYDKNITSILLQGFNWESAKQNKNWYNIMKSKVSEIAEAGITFVWFPPSSQSADLHGYLPGQLYNLNDSAYGEEGELKNLIKEFKGKGVKAVADIVINHRSASHQDEHGNWNMFEGGNGVEELNWGPEAIVQESPFESAGASDTGETYHAAPDIDHTNKSVQKGLINWLQWLRDDIGFDAWRFDFSKGYDPAFTALYIDKTKPTGACGELWSPLKYMEGGEPEYNQDDHRKELCDWIDRTGGRSAAFDFTTKGILQVAVNGQLWRLVDPNGKPPGLIGWYPERAVTFIENHDTGSTQQHWPFPSEHVMEGYAYILTHPGVPCVFWDHMFDWGLADEIKALIAIRKRMQIHAKSSIRILIAEADVYIACIGERVTVKLGPRYDLGELCPDSSEWNVAASGKDYVVWENIKAREERENLKEYHGFMNEEEIEELKQEGGMAEGGVVVEKVPVVA